MAFIKAYEMNANAYLHSELPNARCKLGRDVCPLDGDFFTERMLKEMATTLSDEAKPIYQGVKDATIFFVDRLKSSYYPEPRDVWVAFIANQKIGSLSEINEDWVRNNTEMVMSVNAKKEFPLISHMGIVRNISYTGEKHKNISIQLHGFAAKACMSIYGEELKYMATAPLPDHLKLLEKHSLSNIKNDVIAQRKLGIIESVFLNPDIEVRDKEGKTIYKGANVIGETYTFAVEIMSLAAKMLK